MIQRYCDGQIPAGTIPDEARLSAKRAGVETDDAAIRNFLSHARDEFVRYLDALDVQQGPRGSVGDRGAYRQNDLGCEAVGSGERRGPEYRL